MYQVLESHETTVSKMSCLRGRPENSTRAAVHTAEEKRNSVCDYDDMTTTAERMDLSRPATALGMKEESYKKLESLYIHPIIPVLFDLPIDGTKSYLDTDYLLRIEPMNVFHVAMSRLLKDTAAERIRFTTKTTNH